MVKKRQIFKVVSSNNVCGFPNVARGRFEGLFVIRTETLYGFTFIAGSILYIYSLEFR